MQFETLSNVWDYVVPTALPFVLKSFMLIIILYYRIRKKTTKKGGKLSFRNIKKINLTYVYSILIRIFNDFPILFPINFKKNYALLPITIIFCLS